MSKYAQIRAIMGGQEEFNDKVKNGRVLKWFHNTVALDKEKRDLLASEIYKNLKGHGVTYVQKVQVRKYISYCISGGVAPLMPDTDKICVYIDNI